MIRVSLETNGNATKHAFAEGFLEKRPRRSADVGPAYRRFAAERRLHLVLGRLKRRCLPRQLRPISVVKLAVFALALLSSAALAGVKKGGAKAQVYAACHGVDGNSGIPTIPSLAGQPRQFITQALFMFREGHRKNEQMAPFVSHLSNADLNDLSLYFSTQKLTPPTRKPEGNIFAHGRAVTEKNNCVACYTPTLVGQQHIPRMAGQHKPYLWSSSRRSKHPPTLTSMAR